MNQKNLWGDLPAPQARPPVTILREQAALLGQMTENILEARVRQIGAAPDGDLNYALDIQAPALDNYYFTVLEAKHPVAPFYPLLIAVSSGEKNISCQNEAEFVTALGEVLSSPEVKTVISSLLAQSTALEQSA